ncbi:hypothetical protein QNN00_02110 [Bacillus velezensis]|nr:hypothetical protein [Bacillus velezensis]
MTKESYQLYREMSGNDRELGSRMPRLAGEIHEVKKTISEYSPVCRS